MKLKNTILYQVATNRDFKVGDTIHFEENFNGQLKIFDFEFNENGNPLHGLGFQSAKKGIFKDKDLMYKMSNALGNYDLFMREIALEEVRKEKFPTRPSRFKCMYLSETVEETIKNWEIMTKKFPENHYQVVAVKLNGEAFYVKDCVIGRPGVSFNQYKQLAEKYWGQNQKSAEKTKEILFIGDAEIVKIIKDSTATRKLS